jgi:tRNA U34 5-methylaminomethyl-2-thiouridine-forming methyltransferase MnmC
MADKELRKLSRAELIEMLLEQSKRVANLEEQLKKAKEKLKNREIILNEAGNIAEAALRLNNVFEDAQAASEQYVQGLKALFMRENELIHEYESQVSRT